MQADELSPHRTEPVRLGHLCERKVCATGSVAVPGRNFIRALDFKRLRCVLMLA
jgi:hypothetical protein